MELIIMLKRILKIMCLIIVALVAECAVIVLVSEMSQRNTIDDSIHYVDNMYFENEAAAARWFENGGEKIKEFWKGYVLVDEVVRSQFEKDGYIVLFVDGYPDKDSSFVADFNHYGKVIRVGTNCSNTAFTTIHEFGHYVDYKLNTARLTSKIFRNTYKKYKKSDNDLYSSYHLNTASEFFAQSYAVSKVATYNYYDDVALMMKGFMTEFNNKSEKEGVQYLSELQSSLVCVFKKIEYFV